mmetsp:Transcript_34495/g.31185  ORF Transcript_34495/g.31185 Transcript_34495/m.31185 type:complete len:104 (-) Transcript_34495:1938-2249(-)
MGSLSISYILNNYVILKEVAHAWQLLAYKFRNGVLKSLKNEDILKALDYRWPLNSIVKSVFKNSVRLDAFVFEMLSMIGEGVSKIGMNRLTLHFKDVSLERRF